MRRTRNQKIRGELEMEKEDPRSFPARIRQLFSPRDVTMIELACELAKVFCHPRSRRVAIILLDEACCADPDTIIAALFSGKDEGSGCFPTIADIETIFGAEVARVVRVLIPQKMAGGTPDDIEFDERLRKYGKWPELLINACSLLEHLRSFDGGDDADREERLVEHAEWRFPHVALLHGMATDERSRQKADELDDKIKRLVTDHRRQLQKRPPA
jgi:hypothetical protein